MNHAPNMLNLPLGYINPLMRCRQSNSRKAFSDSLPEGA
jgi:hypothetical protein